MKCGGINQMGIGKGAYPKKGSTVKKKKKAKKSKKKSSYGY